MKKFVHLSQKSVTKVWKWVLANEDTPVARLYMEIGGAVGASISAVERGHPDYAVDQFDIRGDEKIDRRWAIFEALMASRERIYEGRDVVGRLILNKIKLEEKARQRLIRELMSARESDLPSADEARSAIVGTPIPPFWSKGLGLPQPMIGDEE